MQPTITRSLRRAEEIPCMLICSGTSRLVVIAGPSLPPAGEQRNPLLLDLMLGHPHGLGGGTSQTNKVAVVSTDARREAFNFHFYQVVHQTGQLLDRMECSNAAAASGLFARLSRVALPAEGLIHTTNTATGQKISLSLPPQGEMWKQPWGVRFNLPPALTSLFLECAELHQGRVPFHVVPHGNVFVFCNVSPLLMTPELALEIAREASEVAVERGLAVRPFLPKVIPYDQADEKTVSASSWFEGERHASIPGSAAMALALFLRLVRPNGLECGHDFQVVFPGGQMAVRLGFSGEHATFTEFETPIRLLLHGAAPVPPEHSFMLEQVKCAE